MNRLKNLSPLLIIILCHNLPAQVITDGSMGHKGIIPADNHHQITIAQNIGTTAGNNLFHSFQTFNINSNESVTFTGSNNLQNVISRVTGGQISHINGLLKSNIAQANFYFINPAGIFFDKHAQVDVPAAFHISTSDSLHFSDGHAFLASLAATTNNLSVAPPTDFGFLNNNSGDIHIQGANNYDYHNAGCNGNCLEFTHHNDVLLNANTIIINQGALLNHNGTVSFNANNILLDNNSAIDTSTHSATTSGDITISATKLTVDNSNINANANANSTGNAGTINIKTKELAITGNGQDNYRGIFSRTYATGNAGNIALNSDSLSITNQGGISGTTYAKGDGGLINIRGNSLNVLNGAYISSNTNNSGHGGNIEIDVNNIRLDGQGHFVNNKWIGNVALISSNANSTGDAGNLNINGNSLNLLKEAYITSNTSSSGHGGNIEIDVNNIMLKGDTNNLIWIPSAINSNASASGHAGNVNIEGYNLVLNKGQISSSTWGTGNAGDVKVNINNNIDIDNAIIGSDTHNAGNAGTVNVTGDNLTILNSGKISSDTVDTSSGQAGDVVVNANTIDIGGYIDYGKGVIDYSAITAEAFNSSKSGQTGNITVIGNKHIYLHDGGQIAIRNGVLLHNPTIIKPSRLSVTAPDILLESDAQITTQSVYNINSGQLTINFEHQLSLHNASITTEANAGNGGNITINGGELINLYNSKIHTITNNIKDTAMNGDVTITADVLLMNEGEIVARLPSKGNYLNKGGFANLNFKAIVPSNNQLQINDKTFDNFEAAGMPLNIIRTADSGWVTPQLNISGDIVVLNPNTIVLPNLNKDSCDNAPLRKNSLIHKGKGGLTFNEKKWVFVPAINLALNAKLQSAISPNQLANNSLIDNKTPCVPLTQ
ncbi:MAG: filamentous hemagglutinin N-terminal domain-containing protein [Methylococcaceae bacterium]